MHDSASGKTLVGREEIQRDLEEQRRNRDTDAVAEAVLDNFLRIVENGRQQIRLQQQHRWGQSQVEGLRSAMRTVLVANDRDSLEWLESITSRYCQEQANRQGG